MTINFCRQNLRGRCFRGQDLTGANFSYADIRGSDFTQAILVGTNFSHAKTGLKIFWLITLRVILLFLTILAGFISAYAGASVGGLPVLENQSLPGLLFIFSFTLILFLGFILITIFQGIGKELWLFALAVITSVTVLLAFPGTDEPRAYAVLLAIVITINIAGVLVGAIAVTVFRILSKTRMLFLIGLATLGAAVLGIVAGCEEIIGTPAFITALAITIPVTIALVSMSVYIGYHAAAGDEKYVLIRSIAIVLCSYGGTSFRGANLTDADFSYAALKNTDFREANLTRTCWFRVQKIDYSRIEGTYLENSRVQKLAVTKNGQAQNFDGLDLRGLNLQNANLADGSFIAAKLTEANLSNADLSRAKLVQSQLYSANLTEACLTGAIIEDWGISTDTILEQVKCDYIYMHLPTPSDLDPWRKPDNQNEIFEEGDFADFIAPIIKTLTLYESQNVDTRVIKFLDLYHYEGIDPTAAAIALKQLAEKYPEAGLEVVALEGRGNEKIRLQAKVTGIANRSALSAEYSAKYKELASLPYKDLQLFLVEIAQKDERIRSLENMVLTAIQSQKFYVETTYNLGNTSQIVIDSQVDAIQAVTGNDNQQSMQIGSNKSDEKQLTVEEVIQKLEQIEQLISSAELADNVKKKSLRCLESAKDAVLEVEPDKNFAASNLKKMVDTLRNGGEVSSQSLCRNVEVILEGLNRWFG